MAELKYVTSPKLKTYYATFDGELQKQFRNAIGACFIPNPIIDIETLSLCQLIMDGVWIHIRVMQGINLTPENVQFVTQDDSQWGKRGQDFWLKIGGKIGFGVVDNNTQKFAQLALVTVFPPIAPLLVIFNAFDSIFNSDASKKRKLDHLKDMIGEWLSTFNDFLKDWEKEDRLQNPEKYAIKDKDGTNRTPTTFTALANPDATITVKDVTNGDIIFIDGILAGTVTGNTFTSGTQKDGVHKVTVTGKGQFSYADSISVTTKAALLSAPLAFVQNNGTKVAIVVIILILVWVGWKRGVFSR
jgi:hypothetical protein